MRKSIKRRTGIQKKGKVKKEGTKTKEKTNTKNRKIEEKGTRVDVGHIMIGSRNRFNVTIKTGWRAAGKLKILSITN